jgi:hypothetical protein
MQLDEFHEVRLGGRATIELEAVIPHLGVIEEVEGGVLDVLGLRHPAKAEIPLATVEPRLKVTGAVEFQKFNLVGGLVAGDGGVPIITAVIASAAGKTRVPRQWWCKGVGALRVARRHACYPGAPCVAGGEVSPPLSTSRWRTEMPSACCCCLASRTSTVRDRTSSVSLSNFRARPSSVNGSFSFPVPVLVFVRGMDTRLS